MKKTIYPILGWFFGIIFIFSGLGIVANNFFASLLILLAGLLAIPSIAKLIVEKFHITLDGKMRILIIVILFVTGSLLNTISLVDKTTENISQQNIQKNTQTQNEQLGEPTTYEIIETKDGSHKAMSGSLTDYTLAQLESLPTDKKMIYSIVLPQTIKANQVRPTMEKMIKDITNKDKEIDEIAVHIYSDRELLGRGYDVGSATWAPSGKLGNVTPTIARNNDRSSYSLALDIRDDLDEYLTQKGQSEDKFGYSEVERRKIFKEIVTAEDRATAEAEQKYSTNSNDVIYWVGNNFLKDIYQENFTKNMNLYDELANKYRKQVLDKYSLTEEEQSAITTEAFQERWPLE